MRRFRVRPTRAGTLYFDVRIYDDRRKMLRALARNDHKLGVRVDWSATDAVCRSFQFQRFRGRRWRSLPILGVLFFNRQVLGAGIVAHEMAHAAVQWARRVGLSGHRVWNRRGTTEWVENERFAFAVGNLCAQFWTEYYRRRR